MIVALLLSFAPTVQALPQPKAVGLGTWVTNEDYPAAAIEAGEAGITSFRLDVDRNGEVSGCAVTGSSGSQLLDSTTCVLLRMRARFLPATDAKGRAVASSYNANFKWVLPDEAPIDTPAQMVTKIALAPNGTVTDCSSITAGAFTAEDGKADCESLTNQVDEMLVELAPAYSQLRFVTSISPPEEAHSDHATPDEKIVAHHIGEIHVSDRGRAVRCVSIAQSGSAGPFCDTFWSDNPPRASTGEPEVRKSIGRRFLYGRFRGGAK